MAGKSRFFLVLFGMTISLASMGQKYGKTPEDSIKCIENTSIYQEFFRQKKYSDCYEPWKNVLNYCPKSSLNIYIRGASILKHMIENAKDITSKNNYVNELYHLYDLRSDYFGEIAENKARKAIEIRNYNPDSITVIYNLLKEAVEESKENLDPVYIYVYFLASLDFVKSGKEDAALLAGTYEKTVSILKSMTNTKPDKKEDIEKYLTNIEALFSPYASCEQLVEIFKKKFEENPDAIDLLKRITSLLEIKECTGQELFILATEKLHQLEPSPKTTYLMGRIFYDKKQYSKALSYLKEAIGKLQETKDIYNAYLLLAATYGNLNQYADARSAAYKAVELYPTKGQPYLTIASLYAQSASECGNGPVYEKAAYWAAVDKCIKAKSVDSDPNLVSEANILENLYSSYFPEKEEAYMENLEDGMSYTFSCWIGETTTVRTKK